VTPVVVLVTDPRHGLAETSRVVREAAAALGPNRLLVQLREKDGSEAALLESARALRDVTRHAGALLVVNDSSAASLRVAHAVGADGMHLPDTRTAHAVGAAPETSAPPAAVLTARVAEIRALLGDDAFVTTAAHDDDGVRAAIEAFASAALVSPIFTTPGKGAPRGVAALTSARTIADAARRPPRLLVYALGGVTTANATACAEAGADGVAAIRALYEAPSASDMRSMGEPFLVR
jgi:thiamine-phosphate pyrophosphorylase